MLKERIDLYREIEKERNSKLLVFITGDRPNLETQISSEMQDYFVDHLDKFDLPDKITLFLYTRGGDTMAAWSLINLIKQFCKSYEVIIVSKARSAGTLISLGAKNIIMTKQATLGPIDPSLNSPLNPQNPSIPQNPQARVPVSVESIKGFFEYAKQELKISNENDLTKIFNVLADKIKTVFDDIHSELELSKRYDPNVILGNQNSTKYSFRRALIESIQGGTDVFVSEGEITKKQVPINQPGLPPLQRTAIEDQRIFEGWKHEN